MEEIVNQTPTITWEMDVSGPVPMKWYISDEDDVPTVRPVDIVCELSLAGYDPVTLAVGSGIVLSTQDGVGNALVTTTPVTADLEDFPIGATIDAEWREGTPGAVVLRGKLILM